MQIHNLGFSRIGRKRQLKRALEAYWQGDITQPQLLQTGKTLRNEHWQLQQQAGIDLLPVGDFAWYDHVLATSLLLGVVPDRHQNDDGSIDLDSLFRIARGRSVKGKPAAASLLLINLLTAALLFWLTWASIGYVQSAARIGRASSALQVPLHYIYLLIPLGLGMSGLQFLRHAFVQMLVLLGCREAPPRHVDAPLPPQA